MIQGLVQLFIFQALGELLSKFALPFIPGPVLGLVLLLAFLALRGHVPAGSPAKREAAHDDAVDFGNRHMG